jgi:sulfur-oxidizing protein SoxZ
VRIATRARPGEVIEIRTLFDHPMETGLRHDGSAAPARDMVVRLDVRRDGALVFAADLRNGTAANPFHVFWVRMEATATFSFTWTDERGRAASASARVVVA